MTQTAQPMNTAAMTLAWKKTWAMGAAIARASGGIKRLFALMLKQAWAEVKAKAARPAMTAAQARDALWMLENKDRWTQADYDEAARLKAIIIKGDEAAKRDLIAGAEESLVTFTKADGTERTMRVTPAALQRHTEAAQGSKTAQRAAKTRKARHSHLLPVWDADKAAPRSVNLATVSRIVTGSQTHVFQ